MLLKYLWGGAGSFWCGYNRHLNTKPGFQVRGEVGSLQEGPAEVGLRDRMGPGPLEGQPRTSREGSTGESCTMLSQTEGSNTYLGLFPLLQHQGSYIWELSTAYISSFSPQGLLAAAQVGEAASSAGGRRQPWGWRAGI